MRALLLLAAAGFGVLQAAPPPVPPPGTDIYLLPLTSGVAAAHFAPRKIMVMGSAITAIPSDMGRTTATSRPKFSR